MRDRAERGWPAWNNPSQDFAPAYLKRWQVVGALVPFAKKKDQAAGCHRRLGEDPYIQVWEYPRPFSPPLRSSAPSLWRAYFDPKRHPDQRRQHREPRMLEGGERSSA